MRRLILLRHAKSAWDTGVARDHDRPLNDRGRADAPRVGARLAALGWVPERVISSDAQRTRETWEHMAEAFEPPVVDVVFSPRLYGADLDILEEILADQDDVRTLMLIGHNPGWQDAVAWLTGQRESMTTANAALLEGHHASWLDGFASRARWTLVDVVRPKEND
jgi:phosphohistidine phosphatase